MSCEDNEQLKKSMEELIYIGTHSQDERVRIDVHKYIISQLIGNPKQVADITSKGEQLKAGIFVDWSEDEDIQTP